MAVVNNFNQQDDQDNSQQPSTAAPISISGASAAPASGPANNSSSAAPTIQGAPTSSGRFQNLQGYLNANSGYNAAGGGLAGQITGDLSKQEQQQEKGITDAQGQWTTDNSSKNIDPNAASQYVNNGITDATNFASDPSHVQQFQSYLNAKDQYTAPAAYDTNQSLQSGVQNYQSNANLTNSEPGRYTLLNQMYGNPNYSQGQQKLDNLFLQADPNQGANLSQGAQANAANLNNAYAGANAATGSLANQYAANAAATQDASRQALGGAITNFGTQATDAATAAGNARAQALQSAQSDYGRGQVSLEDAAKYGIDLNSANYGVNDLSPYLRADLASTPTAQNIITPEQQKQIAALSQLAGNSLSGDPTQVLGQFNGNTAAGTYNSNPYNFDTGAYSNAVAAGKVNLNNELTPFLNANNLITPPKNLNINDPLSIIKMYQDDMAFNKSGSAGSVGKSNDKAGAAERVKIDQNKIDALKSIFSKYGINPTTGTVQSGLTSAANIAGHGPSVNYRAP